MSTCYTHARVYLDLTLLSRCRFCVAVLPTEDKLPRVEARFFVIGVCFQSLFVARFFCLVLTLGVRVQPFRRDDEEDMRRMAATIILRSCKLGHRRAAGYREREHRTGVAGTRADVSKRNRRGEC